MDELKRALQQTHPDDLPAIRKYVAWVQFRRVVHQAFYFNAHWVKPVSFKAHWVR